MCLSFVLTIPATGLVVRNKIKKIAKDIPTSGTYELDVKSGGYREIDIAAPDYTNLTIHVFDGEEKVETKQIKVNVIDGGGRRQCCRSVGSSCARPIECDLSD